MSTGYISLFANTTFAMHELFQLSQKHPVKYLCVPCLGMPILHYESNDMKDLKVIGNGKSSQAGEPVKANYLCRYKIAYSVPILKDQLISPMIVQNGVEYLTSVLLQLFSQPSSGTDVRTQATFFLSLLSHLKNSLPTRHL